MNAPNTCPDCGVDPGQFHHLGCDVERCNLCGAQAISCMCVYEVNGMDPLTLQQTHPDVYTQGPTETMEAIFDARVAASGGRGPWTGQWPGKAECIEFGWFSKWVEGQGWVRCDADDPNSGPNLNRLNSCSGEIRWEPSLHRWVKREQESQP